MSFQTLKTFVHLWNTNEYIFNEISEISVPPLKVSSTRTNEVCSHVFTIFACSLMNVYMWIKDLKNQICSSYKAILSLQKTCIKRLDSYGLFFTVSLWTFWTVKSFKWIEQVMNKVLWVWNDIRVSIWWQNSYFFGEQNPLTMTEICIFTCSVDV